MKIETSKSNLEVSVNTKSNTFDIANEMKSHVLTILRQNIYSNPILAVVREYFCNAVDSHLEVGKPISDIVIAFPAYTRWETYTGFRIKDQGAGLSAEDAERLLRFYGSSTKQTDDTKIGGLGLGFKCAFAYCETFTVTAVKNGKKVILCATKAVSDTDEHGTGSISVLSEEDTTEPNGVEINIPLSHTNYTDVSKFTTAVTQVMSSWKRAGLELPKVVYGGYDSENLVQSYVCGADAARYAPKVAIVSNANQPHVNIHGIEYAIPTSNAPAYDSLVDKHRLHNLKSNKLVYFADIGEVDINVSRETVRLTEKTLKFLDEQMGTIVSSIQDKVDAEIAANPPKTVIDYILFNTDVLPNYPKVYTLPNSWNSIDRIGMPYGTSVYEVQQNVSTSRYGYKSYIPLTANNQYKKVVWMYVDKFNITQLNQYKAAFDVDTVFCVFNIKSDSLEAESKMQSQIDHLVSTYEYPKDLIMSYDAWRKVNKASKDKSDRTRAFKFSCVPYNVALHYTSQDSFENNYTSDTLFVYVQNTPENRYAFNAGTVPVIKAINPKAVCILLTLTSIKGLKDNARYISLQDFLNAYINKVVKDPTWSMRALKFNPRQAWCDFKILETLSNKSTELKNFIDTYKAIYNNTLSLDVCTYINEKAPLANKQFLGAFITEPLPDASSVDVLTCNGIDYNLKVMNDVLYAIYDICTDYSKAVDVSTRWNIDIANLDIQLANKLKPIIKFN